jgi:caffeoyl-CoA O-methyltransferase
MPKIKRNETNRFSKEKQVLEEYLAVLYNKSFDPRVLETKPKEDSFLEVSVSQGKFLELLVRLTNPKRILEVGAFRGFSGYFLARFLQGRAKLFSIERDERRFEEIETLWKKLRIQDKAQLLRGDAITILKELKGARKTFDFFFVDARKRDTRAYFNLCYSLASKGAVIVVDNTLWGGEVAGEEVTNNAVLAMKEFNAFVMKKYKHDAYMLPAWDGVTIIVKK